ncbi:cytochrome P450 4c21-like isoform X2 [Lycorma delicatula]|uniref:cytochrome P450 4c21-like isoform X2 n=1 Tax=Lycorma delicatula TaxID=130591 RepID=UPI003F511438
MILEVLIVTLLIIVYFIIAAHAWPSRRTVRLLNKFPGPPELPLLGHTITLSKIKIEDLLLYFQSVCKEYNSSPYKLWFVNYPIIILNDPEDIEVLLSSVHNIRKGITYKIFESWLNEGLLISTGSKWHHRRKLLTPTFHFKILEDCMSVFNKNAQLLTEELLEMNDKIITIEPFISKCTLFIICEAAMGVSLENLPDKGEEYAKATKKMNNINMTRLFAPWLFHNWIFNLTPIGRECNRTLKTLHSFTEMIIKERRAKKSSEQSTDRVQGKQCLRTFLDCLLELNENDPGLLSIDDIREEVDTFMFEGHDTTSAAITAAIFMLGHNPEVQENIFKELDEVFGDSERESTIEDLNRLDYLDRVIKETLRLYPSVPALARETDSDIELRHRGYIIPSTTNVFVVPYILHRNSKYYSNPEKFDPDRFLPDQNQQRHPFSYIPFSGGPRNCIAIRLKLEDRTLKKRREELISEEKQELLQSLTER